MRVHELKTWKMSFEAVLSDEKRFEFRKGDRNFRVGDMLWLREYCPFSGEYSGRSVHRMVTHLSFAGGFVIMSLQTPTEAEAAESVELVESSPGCMLNAALLDGVESTDSAMGVNPGPGEFV